MLPTSCVGHEHVDRCGPQMSSGPGWGQVVASTRSTRWPTAARTSWNAVPSSQPARRFAGPWSGGRGVGEAGVGADHDLDRLPRGQPGQGREAAAEVEFRPQQVGQATREPSISRQRLLQHVEGQGPRPPSRRDLGEVEQPATSRARSVALARSAATAAAQQVLPVGIVTQPDAAAAKVSCRQVGKDVLAAVLQQPLDRALDQLLEVADHLVDRDAAGLGLGNGDLLQGVLDLDAGGVELLDQVGPVQQLERRDLLRAKPAVQQPADPLAGVDGVEVRRA